MSAFNQARYNLTRYNIVAGGQVWCDGAANVSFGFSFAGTTNFCKANARTMFIANDIKLDKGRIFRGTAAETFAADVNVLGYFSLKGTGREVFSAQNMNLSQIAMATGASAEDITAIINLSQIAMATANVTAHLDTERCNVGQIVWAAADTGEVFLAIADVISLTEHTCEFFELTLGPGKALVIDASTYNVLLDGQNAIHYQKGDWLDNLSRNTQSIVISGNGASRLEAEILYTERYL